MVRLVIDTDPGVDDAQAILLAAAHPEARIEAVTTVAGNVGLAQTTVNACAILDVLALNVPVYAGCAGAILGPMEGASHVHGEDGLGDVGRAKSARQPESTHAVQALIDLANEAPAELLLVALGPLTNVALATRLDPELPSKFQRLVCMGGAIRGMGNTANPTAEFNVFSDPEAAHIVYESWPEPLLVPWETVMEQPLDAEEIAALKVLDSPRSEFFWAICEKTLAFIEERLGARQLFAADALAMAAALEPEHISQSERRHVRVALSAGHTRGQTSVDWFRLTPGEPNVEMVLGFDEERWKRLLEMSLQ